MRESSLVPTMLLDWPRVAPLIGDHKFMFQTLWASPFLSCAGCGVIPVKALAASLGHSPEASETGLEDIAARNLITRDKETGEIFVNDWFRFHKFRGEKSQKILAAAIAKIQSEHLRALVHEKSTACSPRATSSSYSSSSSSSGGEPAPANKIKPPVAAPLPICEQTGVILQTQEDRQQVAALIKKHGLEKVKGVADRVREEGMRVWPSEVAKRLSDPRAQSDGDDDLPPIPRPTVYELGGDDDPDVIREKMRRERRLAREKAAGGRRPAASTLDGLPIENDEVL